MDLYSRLVEAVDKLERDFNSLERAMDLAENEREHLYMEEELDGLYKEYAIAMQKLRDYENL